MCCGVWRICSRDGVVSGAAEGLAAPQSFEGQPTALEDPVSLDGLVRVARAGRLEATGRRQRRSDCPLVDANQAHGRSPSQAHARAPRADQKDVERSIQVNPGRLRAWRSGDQQQVVSGWQLLAAGSKRLVQTPPNAVAHDRRTDAAAHRDAHPHALEVIWRHVQHQQSVRPATRCLLAHAGELGRGTQALQASLALHASARWRSPPGRWRRPARRRSGACAHAGDGASERPARRRRTYVSGSRARVYVGCAWAGRYAWAPVRGPYGSCARHTGASRHGRKSESCPRVYQTRSWRAST